MSEQPPHPATTTPHLPRYAAIAILFLTLGTCTLQVLAAVDQLGRQQQQQQADAPVAAPAFAGFIPPLLTLLTGVGLAALIEALARLIEREPTPPSAVPIAVATPIAPPPPANDQTAAAFKQLAQSVAELRTVLQASLARPAVTTPPPAPAAHTAMNDRHLQRIVQLLEKLNERPEPIAETPPPVPAEPELAPAPAPEPQVAPPAAEPEVISEPAAASLPEPKEEVVVAVVEPKSVEQAPAPEPEPVPEPEAEAPLIAAADPTPVPAAEDVEPPVQLLEEEEEAPTAAVEAIAPPVDPAQVELAPLHRQVNELLASSSYDLALAAANDFVRRYPQNPAGQELVKRIVQEAEVYVEQTTARLFDEIRSSVERRQWRRALEMSQRLLEKFPEHPRASKIRQQLRPIQHNAEMEERQVQEVRIQELIRARRYAESIDLCEDLIRRFPQSTQAATLTGLLPKLRERAAAEGAGAGSGVFAS
jgi:hypothetical protein